MNGLKTPVKRLISLAAAACTMLAASVTALADEPYKTYNYDNWEDAIPSQTGYTIDCVLTGKEMGFDQLRDPACPIYMSDTEPLELEEAKDFFNFGEEELWIADTGNNRVLCLDSSFRLKACYKEAGGTSFKEPHGLFVMISPTTGKKTLFVADYGNDRVVRASVDSPTELTLEMEYLKPTEALYTAKTFTPSKVVVDYAENVYVVAKSVNTGSIQFRADGTFMGFYGANRVQVTAKVIAQKLWRKIASNEQIAGMSRSVPTEYANFDMDNEGFIYTVTEVSTSTDAVKKINPAGYNIWDNVVGNDYVFGDHTEATYDLKTSKAIMTKLTDISVNDSGIINVLDYETGRVFQYDRLCNLICIFGTKNSAADQRGSFSNPNAVESFGTSVLILDGSKTRNDITVFRRTTFGENLHKAFEYYDEGLYEEAAPYWREVIKRDGGYTYAHVGLGKADLKAHNYKSAMKRFKIANDKSDYDKAFEYYREQWLQDHFTVIAVIVVVLVILWVVMKILAAKGVRLFKKKKKQKGRI